MIESLVLLHAVVSVLGCGVSPLSPSTDRRDPGAGPSEIQG